VKQHKIKIIAGFLITALLVGAWFIGEDFSNGAQSNTEREAAIDLMLNADTDTVTFEPSDSDFFISETDSVESASAPYRIERVQSELSTETLPGEFSDMQPEPQIEFPTEAEVEHAHSEMPEEAPEESQDGASHEATSQYAQSANSDSSPPYSSHGEASGEGNTVAERPNDGTVSETGSIVVYLTVRADILLNNMHRLDLEKHELVPYDGVIYHMTAVTAFEGESVFDLLLREMRGSRIHMEFRNTPILNSAYIVAINNLYEFDAGELSGWMYSVNGLFPGFGASQFILNHGDVVEWHFTLDMGRDLGADSLGDGSS